MSHQSVTGKLPTATAGGTASTAVQQESPPYLVKWQKVMALTRDNAKFAMFCDFVAEGADLVEGGQQQKQTVVDQLKYIALLHTLPDEDVERELADVFSQISLPPFFIVGPGEYLKEPTQGNGRDHDQQPRRFNLIPFAAIAFSTVRNYLVKGILPRIGLAVVWGPPKCGKSFWIFDLVMHIALGWLYRGRKVQQGTVVYLALEGAHGFKNRVEAWRRRYLKDHQGPVPFYLIDVPVDLVADHGSLILAIRAQLGEQTPVVVVIDTLNRALVGDENKPADMAKFVRAADAIRIAFECLVAIVHHCGVAGGRPRGHTSLPGADDVQIGVERDDNTGISTAKVDHAKDMEAGATVVFRLEREVLGTDQDGDEITSCVVVEAEAAAKGPKVIGQTKVAFDLLTELIASAGEPAPTSNYVPPGIGKVCSHILWRETFYKASINDTPGAKQKAFVRAVLKLQEAKLIGVWSDKVWLAGRVK
jgi:hypothetical protein